MNLEVLVKFFVYFNGTSLLAEAGLELVGPPTVHPATSDKPYSGFHRLEMGWVCLLVLHNSDQSLFM